MNARRKPSPKQDRMRQARSEPNVPLHPQPSPAAKMSSAPGPMPTTLTTPFCGSQANLGRTPGGLNSKFKRTVRPTAGVRRSAAFIFYGKPIRIGRTPRGVGAGAPLHGLGASRRRHEVSPNY